MTFDLYTVGDVVEVQARRHKFKTNEYQATGRLPIIDQGSDFIAGYTDELERAYDGPLPVTIFGDHTCSLKFVDFPFAVGADGTQILRASADVDDRFLYYALHNTALAQFGYQRHFKLLKECKIPIPTPNIQLRIVGILGAYDDLIEVNRRRVGVLEEMARGLFEEWFYRFRFPGRENVPLVDTPYGPLPEGWRWGELGEQIELVYGKALKATERQPGRHPVIGSSGIVGEHNEAYEAGPGIIVGRKGNVGAIVWSPVDFWPIDTVFFVRSAVPQMYLLQLLRRIPFQNTDAAVPGLNRSAALKKRICIPNAQLIESYQEAAWPIRQLADSLIRTNERLTTSRDLLLPRLMSGRLSVSAAGSELEFA